MTPGSTRFVLGRRALAPVAGVCLALALLGPGSAAQADNAVTSVTHRATVRPAAAPTLDWPAYQHGPAHSNAAYGDTAITTANAASLTAKWTFVSKKSTVKGAPLPRFDSSATVVAGMVYITSWNGQVYALNATTGALVWQKSVDFGSSADCPPNGPSGTPAVVNDPVTGASTLYVTGSHYLYALNPTTGAQLWKAAMGPATAAGEARWYDWSSPLVVGGKIYVGMTSACSDLIRGGVIQFNQHTGKKLHTWYAVPAGKVGTSVWTSQVGDGTNVWVTTGNPDPNAGQVYDAFSIVRLSASNLTKVDKWTTPTPINDDLDFGGSPAFVTATVNGVSTPMVGACNKNGNFYMFNRNNLAAGPIWQRQVGAVGGTLQGACVTSPAFDGAQNAIWVAGNQTDHQRRHRPGLHPQARPGHRGDRVGATPRLHPGRLADAERDDACPGRAALSMHQRGAARNGALRLGHRHAVANDHHARTGLRSRRLRRGQALRGRREWQPHGVGAVSSG